MSEAQAIETEVDIKTAPPEVKPEGFVIHDDEPAQAVDASSELEPEVEGETEKPELEAVTEAVKIEVEEVGKPPARRLSGFEKRLRKKDSQITDATAEADALREENKLLRLAQEQKAAPVLEAPDEDNFDTVAEYKEALNAYIDQKIDVGTTEKTRILLDQSQQHTTQVKQVQQADAVIQQHYANADALNISNYDELEGNAADILGEDFVKTIIASTDDSHRILASIGASPGKAAQIAEEIKTNPVKAFAHALRFQINPALNATSLKDTPDPETQVDPGRGVTASVPGLEGVTFT